MANSAPKVKTFLLVHDVTVDRHNDLLTFAGVVSSLAINPQTGTNDRYEVAIEFEREYESGIYIEFRIVRVATAETVWVAGASWDMGITGTGTWVFFTMPSLPRGTTNPGERYLMEVWNKDDRLAYREIGCVPIIDSQ